MKPVNGVDSSPAPACQPTVKKKADWNYHPPLPIALSPVFDFSPSPGAALSWVANAWLKLTPPVYHLLNAIIVYLFLWPSITTMQVFEWRWALTILFINYAVVFILAVPLHLHFYVFAGQKMKQKFDVRAMEKSTRFTFNHQTIDNVFWSLISGVPVWSAWMIVYFYGAANGYAPVLNCFADGPIWFVLFFLVLRFWQSFHFYWIHRLLHVPWLFKKVHHLHHRNVNVGPWSGLSMHPVEHVLYYSSIVIHFVLPSHPLHVIFHLFALNLGAVFSHSGFHKLLVKDKPVIKAGSFHHQLHHRYFECNYGSEEIPLDRWFHSFHDGTSRATQLIRARKKSIFARK